MLCPASAAARVVLIDDEPTSRGHLHALLVENGYGVRTAADAVTGLHLVEAGGVDLVLTELVAGEVTGLDLCRTLRSATDVGVIVVSRRSDDVDKVLALEVGADDYVTKPFADRELLLRVAAVLRRGRRHTPRLVTTGSAAGQMRLDRDGLVADVGGRRVHLSPQEFRLLSVLVAAEGRVLSRLQLEGALWADERERDPHGLEACVRRLRRKIEPDPGHPVLVLAVRRLGYRFGTTAPQPGIVNNDSANRDDPVARVSRVRSRPNER